MPATHSILSPQTPIKHQKYSESLSTQTGDKHYSTCMLSHIKNHTKSKPNLVEMSRSWIRITKYPRSNWITWTQGTFCMIISLWFMLKMTITSWELTPSCRQTSTSCTTEIILLAPISSSMDVQSRIAASKRAWYMCHKFMISWTKVLVELCSDIRITKSLATKLSSQVRRSKRRSRPRSSWIILHLQIWITDRPSIIWAR